jgi:formate/nitrite transporter FocA (FNT family)
MAGSVEVLYAVFSGVVSLRTYVGHYLVPVLLGNTVGGLVFVALLNHIQVASDGARTRSM